MHHEDAVIGHDGFIGGNGNDRCHARGQPVNVGRYAALVTFNCIGNGKPFRDASSNAVNS